MKKRMLIVCAVLACVLLLTSCQTIKDALRPDPKTAEQLWERIGEVMQAYDAHELSMEMDMVMVVEGYAVKSSATGTLIEDTGEDYYYYSETNVKVECDELDIKQESRAISAYVDGKAFELRGEDGYERKLYSKMTAEQYAAYLAADREESSFDADITDCTNATFAKSEDKTWTLTYSGYTKKAIKGITGALSTQELDVFGADIVDVKVTFLTDEDFCVTDISMEFEFDTEEDAKQTPALNVRMKLEAMGDAVVRVTETVDPAKYKEVDDLAIRKEIDRLIEERYEAEQGSFRYVQDQIFKAMGQTEKFTESDTVKYGVKDGRFYYDVKAEYDNADMTLVYEDGTCTVTMEGEEYSEPQTEQEARGLIEMLINDSTYGYHADSVTDIKDKGNGVWEIEQAIDDATELEGIFESMGGTYKSATQTVTVTIKEGKVTEIKNVLTAKGSITSGRDTYEVSYTLQMHTLFTD